MWALCGSFLVEQMPVISWIRFQMTPMKVSCFSPTYLTLTFNILTAEVK